LPKLKESWHEIIRHVGCSSDEQGVTPSLSEMERRLAASM